MVEYGEEEKNERGGHAVAAAWVAEDGYFPDTVVRDMDWDWDWY